MANDRLQSLSVNDPVVAGLLVGRATEQPYAVPSMLPRVPVTKETFKYHKFGADALRKQASDKRALRGKSNEVTWSKDSGTAKVEEHSLKTGLDQREVDAAEGFDIRATAAMIPRGQILTGKEFNGATKLKTAASYAAGHTANNINWKTGDVIEEVHKQKELIKRKIGKNPNKLLLGNITYRITKVNTKVTGMLSANERKLITPQILAALFEVEEVVLGDSVFMGDDGETGEDIWGDVAILGYVNPIVAAVDPTLATPALMNNPSLGYTFQFPYAGGLDWQVRRAIDEEENEWLFYKERYEHEVVFPAAGYLWENTDQV